MVYECHLCVGDLPGLQTAQALQYQREDRRAESHRRERGRFPEGLVSSSQLKYPQAQAYGHDKSTFHFFSSFFDHGLNLWFLWTQFYPNLWNWSSTVATSILGESGEVKREGSAPLTPLKGQPVSYFYLCVLFYLGDYQFALLGLQHFCG
jgi:hypothetical protein